MIINGFLTGAVFLLSQIILSCSMKPYGKQAERHWYKGEDCPKHAKHFKHKARQENKKLTKTV